MKRYRRCIYLYVPDMLIGALLKYIVYKITLGHVFLCNSWTESSISKVLQEIVFLHYMGRQGEGGLCFLTKLKKFIFLLNFSDPGQYALWIFRMQCLPNLFDHRLLVFLKYLISSVQLLSHVQLFASPWTVAHQASLSITNSWSLLKLMSIKLVIPSNHLILCHLLLLLPSIPVSGSFPVSQFFASGGQSIGASASASVLPMNVQDWFPLGLIDLLAVQGTLKSLLQHHSSKTSIPQHSALFIVQLSHPSIHDYWKNRVSHNISLLWDISYLIIMRS